MEKVSFSFIPVILLLVLSCTHQTESEYIGIPYSDCVDIKFNSLVADTISLDGSFTSMSGHWIMRDSAILFLDEHSEYIQEYSTDGEFIRETDLSESNTVTKIGSPVFVSIDTSDNSIFGCDGHPHPGI